MSAAYVGTGNESVPGTRGSCLPVNRTTSRHFLVSHLSWVHTMVVVTFHAKMPASEIVEWRRVPAGRSLLREYPHPEGKGVAPRVDAEACSTTTMRAWVNQLCEAAELSLDGLNAVCIGKAADMTAHDGEGESCPESSCWRFKQTSTALCLEGPCVGDEGI